MAAQQLQSFISNTKVATGYNDYRSLILRRKIKIKPTSTNDYDDLPLSIIILATAVTSVNGEYQIPAVWAVQRWRFTDRDHVLIEYLKFIGLNLWRNENTEIYIACIWTLTFSQR